MQLRALVSVQDLSRVRHRNRKETKGAYKKNTKRTREKVTEERSAGEARVCRISRPSHECKTVTFLSTLSIEPLDTKLSERYH